MEVGKELKIQLDCKNKRIKKTHKNRKYFLTTRVKPLKKEGERVGL